MKAEINKSIATLENLAGDQKKYPKEIKRIRKMGYPAKETLSKKNDRNGVRMPSTQDKLFQIDTIFTSKRISSKHSRSFTISL